MDPHHVDADLEPDSTYHPDADPDSTYHPKTGPDADPDSPYHPDADPDPDPSFQIRVQTLEKVLKLAHIPFILAFHLQINADPVPVPDPADHIDADTDFYLLRIRMRIQITKIMRIRIRFHNTGWSSPGKQWQKYQIEYILNKFFCQLLSYRTVHVCI